MRVKKTFAEHLVLQLHITYGHYVVLNILENCLRTVKTEKSHSLKYALFFSVKEAAETQRGEIKFPRDLWGALLEGTFVMIAHHKGYFHDSVPCITSTLPIVLVLQDSSSWYPIQSLMRDRCSALSTTHRDGVLFLYWYHQSHHVVLL